MTPEEMREAAAKLCEEQQAIAASMAEKCGNETGENAWSLSATMLRDAARAIRKLPAE